jgi:hypothetical protein
MLRGFRLGLALAAFLATAIGEARAQYYPGYGSYGWGGWSGTGTVGGDMARGLGIYNMGAGIYNEDTAVANSIDADTVMRWNQYMYLSQQEANRREYLRMARRQQRDSTSGDLIHKRLLENPTAEDIADGDALNVILDQITDPRIHSSALRLATAPIKSDVVKTIPFENASEGITLSLNQLAAKDTWPPALQGENFAPEREAYQQAVAQAVKEDEDGQISARTLGEVRAAVSRIRAKLHANRPTEPRQLVLAENYVKALAGMSRMLENPETEKVLAELSKVPNTTLGGLLGFMHTYNLRFAPTTTPQQRSVYEALYPLMASHRDKVLKDAKLPDTGATPAEARSHPTEFFRGMHLDHLEGKKSDRSPK